MVRLRAQLFSTKHDKNMKKILICLMVICCSACSEIPTKQATVINEPSYVYNVGNIKYVEFDGHQYVMYASGHRGSICHSPNCPCLEQYKKSNESIPIY